MENLFFCIDGRIDLGGQIIAYTPQTGGTIGEQVELGALNAQTFSDGELCVDFTDSVRGKRVYLLSSPNTSDEIMKLLLAIDAAKRAAAKEIIPILPYFPYARQDKKDQARGPIGAKVMAELLEQRGATSIITYDLHADQIQGFFNIPVTHIEGKTVFDDYIASLVDTNESNHNFIFCGPDAGSGKRVKRMKDQMMKYHNLSFNYVMLDKTRKSANIIDEMIIIGDVTGKDVIILDDLVDTAGTLCKAAEVLMNAGANSVRAIISHGVLSGHAFENIGESVLTELVISDSLLKPNYLQLCAANYNETSCLNIKKGCDKIRVISVCKQIGYAISALNNNMSYEALRSNPIHKED